MHFRTLVLASLIVLTLPATALAQAAAPTDAQIAHIAYTAGQIDVAAADQALKVSQNNRIRGFAEQMSVVHSGINDQALALVTKLHVTPQDNPTSEALKQHAAAKLAELRSLQGPAFDRAYIQNEVAYHKMVDAALENTLIPNAANPELKSLLQSALELFREHEEHAEQIAAAVGAARE